MSVNYMYLYDFDTETYDWQIYLFFNYILFDWNLTTDE